MIEVAMPPLGTHTMAYAILVGHSTFSQQWEQVYILTAWLVPSNDIIVPVVTSQDWQNALQKSRLVDNNYFNIWYTGDGLLLSVSIDWCNKI